MVGLLLASKADPNVRGGSGISPLSLAISVGKIEIVETLINHGADVNMKSGMSGTTPLMDAIIEEEKPIFELLIRKGANMRERDYEGEDAFSLASGHNWPLPPDTDKSQTKVG